MIDFDTISEGDEFIITSGTFRGERVLAARKYERRGDHPGLIEFSIRALEDGHSWKKGDWIGLTTVRSDDPLKEFSLLRRPTEDDS